jgi:hypothetical protein
MLPKSKAEEKKHRKFKREKEVELIIIELLDYVNKESSLKVLEFGSGNGF